MSSREENAWFKMSINDARMVGDNREPDFGFNQAQYFHNNAPGRYFCRKTCLGVAECAESFLTRHQLLEHWEQVAQWACDQCPEQVVPNKNSNTAAGTTENTPTASSTSQASAPQSSTGTSLRRSPRLRQA